MINLDGVRWRALEGRRFKEVATKGSGDRIFVFIVVEVCFTGNRMTILSTNMQNSFLCVNFFGKKSSKLCGESMSETFRFASTRHKKSNSICCSEPLTCFTFIHSFIFYSRSLLNSLIQKL